MPNNDPLKRDIAEAMVAPHVPNPYSGPHFTRCARCGEQIRLAETANVWVLLYDGQTTHCAVTP